MKYKRVYHHALEYILYMDTKNFKLTTVTKYNVYRKL